MVGDRRYQDMRLQLPSGILAYRHWPGRGRPLVLLHGLLDSSEGWDLLASELNRPIYAFDLPGFGSSELPAHAQLSSYAHVISQAIRKLDLNDFILVGHSLGGGVATIVAGNNAERVHQLVLLAPVGFGSLPMAEAIAAPLVSQLTSVVLPLAMKNTLVFNTFYSNMVSHHRPPRPELRERLGEGRPNSSAGAGRAVRALSRCSRKQLCRQRNAYRGPVTVLWGEKDILVSPRHSEGLLKAFPQAKITSWADIGHHPQHEAPEAMRQFIEAVACGKSVSDIIPEQRQTAR